MIVAFSGNDCSGKSTQIDLLKRCLEGRGHRVRVLWHRPGYSGLLVGLKRLARSFFPRTLPTTNQPDQRNRAFRRPTVRFAWKTMALLDMLLQHGVKVRLLHLVGYTIICDRYWLDGALDLEQKFPSWNVQESMSFRLVRSMLPSPKLWVLLSLPWDDVLLRSGMKVEPFPDSPEERLSRFERYQAQAESGPWTAFSAKGDIQAVHGRLLALLDSLDHVASA